MYRKRFMHHKSLNKGSGATAIIIIVCILIIAGIAYAFMSSSPKPALETTSETPAVTGQEPSTPEMTVSSSTDSSSTGVNVGADVSVGTKPAVTVRYDGSVFTPKTVTVSQGQSVTFINDSTGNMSVASDDHPTHTIYPEFDQYKTASRSKKEFTFTFTKVGTWDYHNHLNANAVGTVIVKP